MARQAKRRRRAFGTCKTVSRHGRDYLEFSYRTPSWAFSKWPGLPERCYKVVAPEFKWEGESWLAEAQKALKAGTWEPPQVERGREQRDSVTFREYAVPWVKNRRNRDGTDVKDESKDRYLSVLENYLLPFFGDMPMTVITPGDVQRWLDGFQPVRDGADMVKRRAYAYRVLKSIMKSAAEEPLDSEGTTLIPVSPCRLHVSMPKPDRVPVRPTREQLDALIALLPDWVRMVVLICDSAGLRESEALGLRRRHIDLERPSISVMEQPQLVRKWDVGRNAEIIHKGWETITTTPKTESSKAVIPITRALADRLAEWMDSHGVTRPDDHLFVSKRKGGVLTRHDYYKAFAGARGRVPGLETMVPHDLRKDCLSRMVEQGATVTETMRQGRHRSLEVASRYQVAGDDHMGEVMARMDAYDRGGDPVGAAPASAAATDGPDDDVDALAGMLAGLDVEDRVRVLLPLPVGRRVRVLGLLPGPVRNETMTMLLMEGGGEE